MAARLVTIETEIDGIKKRIEGLAAEPAKDDDNERRSLDEVLESVRRLTDLEIEGRRLASELYGAIKERPIERAGTTHFLILVRHEGRSFVLTIGRGGLLGPRVTFTSAPLISFDREPLL
jgi:hypothetical protein